MLFAQFRPIDNSDRNRADPTGAWIWLSAADGVSFVLRALMASRTVSPRRLGPVAVEVARADNRRGGVAAIGEPTAKGPWVWLA